MAKLYESKKTHMTVASGEVLNISDDRLSITVKTLKYNAAEKKNIPTELTFKTSIPVPEDVEVGKNTTICGFFAVNPMDPQAEGYQAVYISSGNNSFEHGELAIINGKVIFAEYRDEKNPDGTPRMTKEIVTRDGEIIPPKERKPHFDIGISTEETAEDGKTRKVLHVVKEYPYKGDMTKIERYKKAYVNYDRENNPADATIVTAPGQVYPREKEYNGKTYINFYSNHMGISAMDIRFEKTLTKGTPANDNKKEPSKDDAKDAPAPAAPAPAPAPAVTVPPTVTTPPEVNGYEDPIPAAETEMIDDSDFFAIE